MQRMPVPSLPPCALSLLFDALGMGKAHVNPSIRRARFTVPSVNPNPERLCCSLHADNSPSSAFDHAPAIQRADLRQNLPALIRA